MTNKALFLLLGGALSLAVAATLSAQQETSVQEDGHTRWVCRDGTLIGPASSRLSVSETIGSRCHVVAEPAQCKARKASELRGVLNGGYGQGRSDLMQFRVYDGRMVNRGRDVRVSYTGRVETSRWNCG